MNLVVFTDIDDTLMTTGRKLLSAQRATPGAYSANGDVSSYCSAVHSRLWSLLETANLVIPVTARSLAGVRRLDKAFSKMGPAQVADFGGTVTLDGLTPDLAWDAQLQQQAQLAGPAVLDDLLNAIMPRLTAPLLKHELRVTASGLRCFLNFRFDAAEKAAQRARIQDVADQMGLSNSIRFHETDRDVTLLPTYISKGAAVQFLIERLGLDSWTRIGAGDSLTDIGFMRLCHFMVTPSESPIGRLVAWGAQ